MRVQLRAHTVTNASGGWKSDEQMRRAGVRACVRACVHACMRACVQACSAAGRAPAHAKEAHRHGFGYICHAHDGYMMVTSPWVRVRGGYVLVQLTAFTAKVVLVFLQPVAQPLRSGAVLRGAHLLRARVQLGLKRRVTARVRMGLREHVTACNGV